MQKPLNLPLNPTEMLFGVLEGSLDSVYIKDLQDRIVCVNSTAAKLFGKSAQEIIGSSPARFFSADVLEQMTQAEQLKCPLHLFNGDPRLFKITQCPVIDQYGKENGSVTTIRDVTDLEVLEVRYRKIFEGSPISIQVFSPDGKVLSVNDAWDDLWKAGKDVIQNYLLKDYNILTDPQVSARGILPYFQKAFKGEAGSIPPITYDPAEIGQPGRVRTVESYVYPIKDVDGTIREVILLQWDITARVESQKTMNLLAETSNFIETSLDYTATLKRIIEIATASLGGHCEILTEDMSGALPTPVPALVMETGLPVYNRVVSVNDPAAPVRSYIVVPLKVSQKTVGVISLSSISKFFSEHDLALAQELASRASIAIENARLFQEAKLAIKLRDDFLAVASHELKTPLTSLSLQVQSLERALALKGDVAPERLNKLFQNSTRQIRDLAGFIDGLLDVSRFAEGRLTLKTESFDLAQAVKETVAKILEQPERKVNSIEVDADLEVIGEWDRFRLDQVITNLISNALKYGEDRPVLVQVRSEGNRAWISVRDSGIGIDLSNQERVFSRFERAVSGSHYRGVGLGLYITREIVRAHGGEVSVQSELGQGAEFTVSLPKHYLSDKS